MTQTLTARSCGGCTACCKPLQVEEGVFKKPAGEWCKHCLVGKGCSVYQDRPEPCKAFRCEWLKGFGEEADRPDRVRVIIDFHKLGFFKDGVCQIWEVSSGALSRPFTAKTTRWMIERDIPVLHAPLGKKRMRAFLPRSLMYKEVFDAIKEEEIELASLTDL